MVSSVEAKGRLYILAALAGVSGTTSPVSGSIGLALNGPVGETSPLIRPPIKTSNCSGPVYSSDASSAFNIVSPLSRLS